MIKPVFDVVSVRNTGNSIDATLTVNALSEILQGHFPDQPVVPGASTLQVVKDILADTLKADLRLIKADNIKFLGLIVPRNDSFFLTINYQINESFLKVNATLASNEVISMKFQGTFLVL